jgi:hypothetical protein
VWARHVIYRPRAFPKWLGGNAVRLICRLQSVVNGDAFEKLPCWSACFVACRNADMRVSFFPWEEEKKEIRWTACCFCKFDGCKASSRLGTAFGATSHAGCFNLWKGCRGCVSRGVAGYVSWL